jgi:hypothetical protein
MTASAIERKDGSRATSQGPARGYSWVPFIPGNQAAVKHGAFSDAIVSAEAVAFRAALVAECSWILEGADDVAIEQFCRAEARATLLHNHVMTVAQELGVEAVRPYLWAEVRRADLNAFRCTDRLGLSPLARVNLFRATVQKTRRARKLRA